MTPSSPKSARRCARNWGHDRFDFLVNNAGTAYHAAFTETTEAELDKLYNVHFKGVYFLTQKLLPLIQDGGRIVNISSASLASASRARRPTGR